MSHLMIVALAVAIICSVPVLFSGFIDPKRRRRVEISLVYETVDGRRETIEGVRVPQSFVNALVAKLARAQEFEKPRSAPRPRPA